MDRSIRLRAWDDESQTMTTDLFGRVTLNREGALVAAPNLKLMQSTGRFDSKCREIFEGDIVKRGKKTRVVKWVESGVCVGFNIKGISNYGISRYHTIVGNIWQNPNLVKNL